MPAQQAEGRTLTSAPVSTRNFRPAVRSETKNRRLGGWPGVLVAISTWPGRFPPMYRGRYTWRPSRQSVGGTSTNLLLGSRERGCCVKNGNEIWNAEQWGAGTLGWRELMSRRNSATSSRSWATSRLGGSGGVETEDTVGAATSIILSAMTARLSMDKSSPVEASTIRTLLGRHCRKSSLSKELSDGSVGAESPISCCILRSNWVGLRSPSCSAWNRSCRRRWAEAAVRCICWAFRVS